MLIFMKEIKPWKILKSELAFDHAWYKVRRDEVLLPDGHRMDDYFVSLRPEVVLVFPVTHEGEVILVRQYKHGAGEILLELPGGFFDAEQEAAPAAARRELREETGYVAGKITNLHTLYDNPTKDTHGLHLFVAEDARKEQAQDLDVSEDIEIVRIPLTEIVEQVVQGAIRVTGSVALVFLALAYLRREM